MLKTWYSVQLDKGPAVCGAAIPIGSDALNTSTRHWILTKYCCLFLVVGAVPQYPAAISRAKDPIVLFRLIGFLRSETAPVRWVLAFSLRLRLLFPPVFTCFVLIPPFLRSARGNHRITNVILLFSFHFTTSSCSLFLDHRLCL